MDRVEPKTIEMIFLEPVERIVYEVITDRATFGAIEIDRLPPGSMVTISEELGRVKPKVISFGPEVVVYDVEKNHQVLRVGSVNEVLQFVGATVVGGRSVREYPVVSPVALAGKTRYGHHFDNGDAEISEIVESPFRARVSTLRRKSSDVEFINYRFTPWAASPFLVAPTVGAGGNYLTRSMNACGLKARGGIAERLAHH